MVALKKISVTGALLLALALAGCQTTSSGRGGAFCEVEKPIRLSTATIDAMTPDERRQALEHNQYGAKECGWTK
jgi:hypothetical protein